MDDWKDDLAQFCRTNSIEFIVENGKVIFIASKIPDKDTQGRLKKIIPSGVKAEFKASIRKSTITTIGSFLQTMPVTAADILINEHSLLVLIEGHVPSLDDTNTIRDILKNDSFIEQCRIIVDGNVHEEFNFTRTTPVKSDKANRDACPTPDEITDLRIALSSCGDVSDFINSL
jgi:hypothetical protein